MVVWFSVVSKKALVHVSAGLHTNAYVCIGESNKLPVRPVDKRAKHSNREEVHVGRRQYNLPAFTRFKVDPLDLICAGVTPI